ncbi:MAG: 5-methyltetrahydropteroyltriglutamate--homocysteine S-methyltransferase [Finegoldia sp.]|nr:5-methyltetrahydropteroyltriglutamate--homocysteine S-methyltransferase [Finegoldia sp.]
MKTSVIGFPRIGALRELKFACEKYFRDEIEPDELSSVGRNLRKAHLKIQKEAGIDYIPTNDFSFYDNLLDAAGMVGIIPKSYKDLNLSYIDTYFAMARGYQKDGKDVKALAMKKWFNTNYHYIVPEVDDEVVIDLFSEKIWFEYDQAKADGIETKPVTVGPYTLLKLCKFTGKRGVDDVVDEVTGAYEKLIGQAEGKNVSWLQFDEPALVQDLESSDIDLFHKIYDRLLRAKKDVKILLQTYFGDVRDIYNQLIGMDFDGIGFDFIEGKETYNLIKKSGFPKDKVLFAGLVNGKNIWRNSYKKTLEILRDLRDRKIETVISTSCSLLHLPYSTSYEENLSDDYLKHFAFAQEKLGELKDLSVLIEDDDYEKNDIYRKNLEIFETDRACENEEVRKRLASIKQSDYTRLPARKDRQKLQKEVLGLGLFPTTTIESFPQTKDVKKNRSDFSKGKISEEEYIEFNKQKIKECINYQEAIGLDVLVHGEFERNDMVEYFGRTFGGFLFTEKAWVQSYGTRCVKPPIIWGDVYRKEPITVSWSTYAQSLTDKIVKGMLTGPVTILNWSFPREDISIRESILQIALAIREEVLDLEKNGIKIIQIDEAALREKLPLRKSDWYSEYLDFTIPAFRLTHSGVGEKTQIHTHMCYSEFEDIIGAIDDMDADVITFEASRSDLEILDSLRKNKFETEVGPGVYDIHSPRVAPVDEIYDDLKKMLEKIDKDKLWVNPDCGLKTRGVEETDESLRNMVEAAKKIRALYQ